MMSIWCESPFEWLVDLLTAQCLFPPSMVMFHHPLVDIISSKSQAKIPDFHLPRGCHRQQLAASFFFRKMDTKLLCCWTNIFNAFWDEFVLWIMLSVGPWHDHIMTSVKCLKRMIYSIHSETETSSGFMASFTTCSRDTWQDSIQPTVTRFLITICKFDWKW